MKSNLKGVISDLRTFTDNIEQIINLVNTIEQMGPIIKQLSKIQAQNDGELNLETVLSHTNLDLSNIKSGSTEQNPHNQHEKNESDSRNPKSFNKNSDDTNSHGQKHTDSESDGIDKSELSDLLAEVLSKKLSE